MTVELSLKVYKRKASFLFRLLKIEMNGWHFDYFSTRYELSP